MNRALLATAVGGVALATAVSAYAAEPSNAPAPTAQPCRIGDVSYYFGGYTEGLGQSRFDVTLIAHDGTDCTLSDRPAISVSGPRGQKRRAKVHVNGRGGTLELTPETPLHTTVYYTAPDTPRDTVSVSGLTLAMPGGGRSATYFGIPGTTPLAATNGILVSAWTTGIGLGQGEQPY